MGSPGLSEPHGWIVLPDSIPGQLFFDSLSLLSSQNPLWGQNGH